MKKDKRKKIVKNKVLLEIAPAFRLVGMIWISILIIYFLPASFWFFVFKIILGLFIIVTIKGSFHPMWDEYETMGAFVTMQAVWFFGLIWIPWNMFSYSYLFHFILTFLIVIGFATKIKQIKNINKGLGPDLRQKKTYEKIDDKKVKANLFVMKNMSFEVAKSFSKFDDENKELLKFATDSIKKVDFFNIPLGFPSLFVATYPDVLLWWNNLSDEEQDNFFKKFDENDLLDENEKIKTKYLEVIINKFKENGQRLECLYDDDDTKTK